MNILYLGQNESGSTSRHRSEALERIGHRVLRFDPWIPLQGFLKIPLWEFLLNRSGYCFVQKRVYGSLLRFLKYNLNSFIPDLIWVNGGELFGRSCVQLLKSIDLPLVLYNNDDPTGGRDKGRFFSLKRALPYYSLIATMREETKQELISSGCKNVLSVWMSYDEIIHAPPGNSELIPSLFESDVSFIGTWMRHENRHILLRALITAGFNIKIFGSRWNLCPDRDLVSLCWVKGFLADRDYAYAIAGSKVCLGLLSKGNRDRHTRRSVEIPYAGGLLCAERTSEHLKLYREDQDAVFWETPEELVYQCKRLLGNDQLRERIRLSGMARVRQLGVGNETICQSILERAMQCQPER